MSAPRFLVLILAVFATGVASPPAIGYIDLPQLVAAHPLHRVLIDYDRAIAALRETQTLPGLRNPAQAAASGAAALKAQTSAGRQAASQIDSGGSANASARERVALSRLGATQNAAATGMNAYTSALIRETTATLSSFERASAERNARAYAARKQQLREKELTLAFDLEREDAGRRLMLRLKLNDLHLTPQRRAMFKASLAQLDAREAQAVGAQRRNDAQTLAEYRRRLDDQESFANTQMAAQLREKALANLGLRRNVWVTESANGPSNRGLSTRIAALRASSAHGSAAAIDAALRATDTDLSSRLAALASIDAQSRRDTARQLSSLEADRNALYRSIVAAILRDAQSVARQRHLAGIDFVGGPASNSVDITASVKAALTR